MTDAPFSFDSFRFDRRSGRLNFVYSQGENRFEETLILPSTDYADFSEELLQRALFFLHLALGVSYYKTTCARVIELKSGQLCEEEAAFWNKLYTQGLGEFFYQNKVDPRGLVHFPAEALACPQAVTGSVGEKVLLPLGGGKDSLLSAQLLKEAGFDVMGFCLEGHPLMEAQAKELGFPYWTVKREISPRLFELNQAGALNGHVPISSIFAFVSLVVSVLYGFKFVVMSNERSANVGNTTLHGMEINHQYSKSLEFERDLRTLVSGFLSPDLEYFSLLRPLSELHIVKLFCEKGQFLKEFSSCNRNFKILGAKKAAFWCGDCAKCAFVFVLFSAFLERATLLDIFGKNLFEDEALWPTYKELLGLEGIKPFDCVGEPEEVQAAFELAQASGEWDTSPLMQAFVKLSLPKIGQEDLFLMSREHCIPKEFQSLKFSP